MRQRAAVRVLACGMGCGLIAFALIAAGLHWRSQGLIQLCAWPAMLGDVLIPLGMTLSLRASTRR